MKYSKDKSVIEFEITKPDVDKIGELIKFGGSHLWINGKDMGLILDFKITRIKKPSLLDRFFAWIGAAK